MVILAISQQVVHQVAHSTLLFQILEPQFFVHHLGKKEITINSVQFIHFIFPLHTNIIKLNYLQQT